MNDDDRVLASAALDGALTAEERVRVDGDPVITAEVARLARARAAVRATPAPDPARRQAAISAALGAFDAPAPPSVAGRRRRWLVPATAAAAVVLLGVGAIVTSQRDSGGRRDGDDAALVAEVEPAERVASAPPIATRAAPDAAGGESAEATDEATDAAADMDVAAGTEAATEATAVADHTAAGQVESTEGGGPLAATVVLVSPSDLVSFAATQPAPSPTADGAPRCDAGTLVGVALYRTGDGERAVEVFDDGASIVAVDADTCEVVARARN